MIGTIRKHQQWLWAIIITATIISFVIWTGNRGTHGPGEFGPADLGSVAGEKVSREDYTRARNECLLQYLFNTGSPYKEQDSRKANEFEQRIYVRLLLVQKEEPPNGAAAPTSWRLFEARAYGLRPTVHLRSWDKDRRSPRSSGASSE